MQAAGNYILGAESCDLAFATAIEGSLNVESTEVVKGEDIVCNYSLNINQKFIKILTGSLIAQTELPEGLNVKKITVDGIEINNYSIANSILKIPINIQNEEVDETNVQKKIDIQIELATDDVLIDETYAEMKIITEIITENITFDSDSIIIGVMKNESTENQNEVSLKTEEGEIKYSESIVTGGFSGNHITNWTFKNSTYIDHRSAANNMDSKYYFCRQHYAAMPAGYYTSKGSDTYSNDAISWILSTPITSSCHSSDSVQNAIWATSLNSGVKTSENDLNREANDYAEYKSKYVTPAFNENTKIDYSIENIIGPFQVKFNCTGNYGGISTIKLYADNGSEITSGWTITNKEGKSISIKPNTDFYIKFDDVYQLTDDGICKPKLKITFKRNYSTEVKVAWLEGSRTYKAGSYLTCETCSPNGYYYEGKSSTSYSGTQMLYSTSGKVTTVIYQKKYSSGSTTTTASTTDYVWNADSARLHAYCSKCGFSNLYKGSSASQTAFKEHKSYEPTCNGLQRYWSYRITYVITPVYYKVGCGKSLYNGCYCGEYVYRDYTYSTQKLIALLKSERTWTQTTLEVEIPLKIDIYGNVWEDGQTGLKSTNPPNGTMDDDEAKVKEVRVSLWRAKDDTLVTTNIDNETIGNARPGTNEVIPGYFWTDENGQYEIKNILANKYGYYVKFEYDGVNYIATTAAAESGKKVSVGIENSYNKRNTYRGKKNSI